MTREDESASTKMSMKLIEGEAENTGLGNKDYIVSLEAEVKELK